MVEALGARYVATQQTSLLDDVAAHGQHDLVFEATGYSPHVFDAMWHTVARSGILVLACVTGGMRRSEVSSDAINLDFVLGNKVMFGTVNAGCVHFEEGVRDMAIVAGAATRLTCAATDPPRRRTRPLRRGAGPTDRPRRH